MSTHRLRVCIGFDINGSPIIKQIRANSEIALADLAIKTILNSTRRNEFVPELPQCSPCPTFGKYTAEWLETFKMNKLKPTTLKGYNSILRTHFYPEWRNTPINQITTKEIQDFLCERKHLSIKYLHEMRVFLAQIMNSAYIDGLIDKNPVKDSRIFNPSSKSPEIRNALPVETVKEIIASLWSLQRNDRLYLSLVVFTGMRRGEVLGLQWEDIDTEKNCIRVQRNVTYTNNQPFVGTPKTKSGYRSVPIIQDLLAFLNPIGSKGYIVNSGDPNTPITLQSFRCMMTRIHKSVDLRGATAHVFRHSIGTMLNDTGADVKTIQSILGQSDFKTTMDRYVHPREDRKQDAIQKVSKLLNE